MLVRAKQADAQAETARRRCHDEIELSGPRQLQRDFPRSNGIDAGSRHELTPATYEWLLRRESTTVAIRAQAESDSGSRAPTDRRVVEVVHGASELDRDINVVFALCGIDDLYEWPELWDGWRSGRGDPDQSHTHEHSPDRTQPESPLVPIVDLHSAPITV